MEHVLPEEFDSKVLSSEKKTLVLFMLTGVHIVPISNQLLKKWIQAIYKKKAALVNEDENPLWDRFNIQAIPTMIAFQNGKILTRRDAKKGMGLTRADMESIIKELN